MHSIAWAPILISLAIATVSDIRSRRIPNWVVAPLLSAGITASAILYGWRGLGESLSGVALAAFVTGIQYRVGGMGMGDVKLFAAIGAWIWPGQLVLAMVVAAMAGGVMALMLAVCGGFLGDSMRGAGELLTGAWKRGWRPHPSLTLSNPAARSMPYVPAIAFGTIVSFFAGQ
jgi:prepilin peptidase CpaA